MQRNRGKNEVRPGAWPLGFIVLICLGVWGMILWAVIKRRKGPDPLFTKM